MMFRCLTVTLVGVERQTPNLAPESPRPGQPSVICGTLVIPADPQIDPHFSGSFPAGSVTYTMRAVAPPVCGLQSR